MPISSASPGKLLDGRYELQQRIAVGGMGQVWRGRDTVLDRAVAIKLLRDELVDDAAFRARFRQEARNAARVVHPAIAQVYDYAERSEPAGWRAYLVMEMVPGEPLSAVLARERRLPVRTVLSLVAQTADALAVAHAAGIVHRDVKPANLLLTSNGRVKVTDFGIARAAAEAAVTDPGELMGSPHYLAPEQVAGQTVTGVADVFALGVVAYESLAGQRPFSGDTVPGIAEARLRQPAPSLPDDVPPDVAALVMAMLSRRPEQRPADADVVATARRLLAGPAAERAAVGATGRAYSRRRRWVLAGAGTALTSAAVAATVAVLTAPPPATARPTGPSSIPAPMASATAGSAAADASTAPSVPARTVPAGRASTSGDAPEVATAQDGAQGTPAVHPAAPATSPAPVSSPSPGPTATPSAAPTPTPTPSTGSAGPTASPTPSPTPTRSTPAPSSSPTPTAAASPAAATVAPA